MQLLIMGVAFLADPEHSVGPNLKYITHNNVNISQIIWQWSGSEADVQWFSIYSTFSQVYEYKHKPDQPLKHSVVKIYSEPLFI